MMLRSMWTVAVVSAVLTAVLGHPGEYDVQDPGHYLNSFLVRVSSREVAEQVARDNGFKLLEKLPELEYYHMIHPEVSSRSKRSADDFLSKLEKDDRVHFVEQQITLKRVKRTHEVLHDKQLEFPIENIDDNSKYYRVKPLLSSRGSDDLLYNDRYYGDQWYLHNTGQTGGTADFDLNVVNCWKKGYTGEGVVVTILDDGIDHEHEDLKRNYDPKASFDFNSNDEDPKPNMAVLGNDHGTRCAGEIAAQADNKICGVGVAFNVKIGGIRLLDGKITDRLEAQALLFNFQYVDMYSASWGPRDDGMTMEGFKKVSADAIKKGVEEGRGGLGNIYVWATGNGGDNCDHCGADGYVAGIQSISIQSLSDTGKLPYFGERCASTMAGVPAGGEPTKEKEIKFRTKVKVVTTDVKNKCIENFEGTSSAAPLATGCLALLLQAAPNLGWRDVQHLVAKYSRIPSDDDGWIMNGAGYHVNHKCGFGVLDTAGMIMGASEWKNVPEQHTCETSQLTMESNIPISGCYKVRIEFNGCSNEEQKVITHLEHVEVEVKLTAVRRGDMEIFLTSPSGTRSELLGRRCNDDSVEGIDFKFMTVHNWMEDPSGLWSFEVCHNSGNTMNKKSQHQGQGSAGKLLSVKMIAHGFDGGNPNPMKKAYPLTSKALHEKANEEFIRSRNIDLKRAENTGEKKTKTEDTDIDQEDLGIKEIKELFDDISKVFNSRNIEQKKSHQFSTRKMNTYGHVDVDNTEEIAAKGDTEMEDVIGDLLARMDKRGNSNTYLKEILKRRHEEMRRERLRKRLISEIESILDKN